MADRAMRPFWVHQFAEYLIGIALVAQGLQDPDPVVPAVAGVAVLVNAAIVRGPMGAFKWVGRRTHRALDLVVMALIVFGAFQPWIPVGVTGQAVMLVMLLPLGFLWFYTDWAERPARKDRRAVAAGPRSEDIGKSAGRMAANAYLSGKKAIKKHTE
jgi:hypothetical protein